MKNSGAVLTQEDIAVVEELDVLTDYIRGQASKMGAQEVRFLVDTYYEIQERRKSSANQERAIGEAGEPSALVNYFVGLDGYSEKKIRQMLQAYAEGNQAASWAMSIRGIGPVISAGLAAHIDITQAPTVGHIWRFAGLDPTLEWSKGQKRPFNAKLKVLCWKIGESFVKVKNHDEDIYGKLYDMRKRLEEERNQAGVFADQAAAKLEKHKIGKTTEAYKAYSKGKLPPAHIHSRAKRYAVKLFLAHYHHVAYELQYGEAPPKPYVVEHLGHAHYLAPPNWPM
jgi:transposase|tara:strand:- start:575 stop:1423 length:849 start_codon:yes stop_codon:yes gene_type:complete